MSKQLWTNLHLRSPLYGADVRQSLFRTPARSTWNLNSLDSLLGDITGTRSVPGINTPYLYIGGFRTMFAWHVEDYNLGSVNYLHSGSPKLWYVISAKHCKRFEAWVKSHYPQGFVSCSQFLRHKTTLVNPYLLKAEMPDLQIERHVQREGELVVVFESAYHTGFNLGFNVAEAVNYATDAWLCEFMKFKPCQCQSKNLRIDPVFVLEQLRKS